MTLYIYYAQPKVKPKFPSKDNVNEFLSEEALPSGSSTSILDSSLCWRSPTFLGKLCASNCNIARNMGLMRVWRQDSSQEGQEFLLYKRSNKTVILFVCSKRKVYATLICKEITFQHFLEHWLKCLVGWWSSRNTNSGVRWDKEACPLIFLKKFNGIITDSTTHIKHRCCEIRTGRIKPLKLFYEG